MSVIIDATGGTPTLVYPYQPVLDAQRAVALAVGDANTVLEAAAQAMNSMMTTTQQASIATLMAAAATLSASQAAGFAAALASAGAYPSAYAGAVPQGLTSVNVGGTAITGATPGTYALTPVGGSLVGVAANLVVTSATAASVVIINPGLGTGTTPPTFANPAAATLPAGTTLTGVVGVLVPNQKPYWVVTSDATQLLLYGNNAGVAQSYPFGSPLVSLPLGLFIGKYLKQAGPCYWNGAQLRSILDMDPNGRMSAFFDSNGNLYCQLAAESPDGSIALGYNPATGRTTFSSPTTAGVRAVGGGASIDTTHRQIYYGGRAVVVTQRDSVGQLASAVLSDNTNRFPSGEFENGIGLDAGLETANYIYTTRLSNGRRQIRQHNKATGIAIVFASIGNNAHPRLSLDGTSIVYATDRYSLPNGPITWTTMYQPIGGGREHPLVSLPDISCLGDSLTYGYNAYMPYPAWLQMKLAPANIRVANFGLGGQTTSQIMFRLGAATVPVTVTGNTISAGANTITYLGGTATGTTMTFPSGNNPEYRFLSHARGDAVSIYGTLNGIYGTMTRTLNSSNQEIYSFTPDAAVSQTLPASCPAGSVWQSINDIGDKVLLLQCGYNDVVSNFPASVIQANIDAMIAWLPTKSRKFVVFTIESSGSVNAASTGSGATQWGVLQAVNAHLRAVYGTGPAYSAYQFANLFDNFTYLAGALSGGTTTQALTDMGITASAQDLTDIANQACPTTLRTLNGSVDLVHLNDIGYRAQAQNGIYPLLAANGWNIR